MGNILSLRRHGLHDDGAYAEIDNLQYTYSGNQVIRVDDSAIDPVYKDCFTFVDGADDETEYEYDENGNLTKDLNRGICRIGYNCLNLPSRVDFTDGSRITYTYDGGGRKLRTDHYMNPLTVSVPQLAGGTGSAGDGSLVHTWTDYCANKVYENDTLKMSLFDGGYVSYDKKSDASSPSTSYHYYIKDHLGDNRVVLGEDGAIEQVSHYYPFGGLMGGSENLASSQRYKYNGKELDRTHGLDWYDYGARMYDPALARWMVPDPMAEKYYGISPYAYCGDNPIRRMDFDGRDWYENEAGSAALWQDTKDPIIKLDGYEYHNVGSSYTVSYDWGSIDYVQNAALGIHFNDDATESYEQSLKNTSLFTTLGGWGATGAKEYHYSEYFNTWKGQNNKIYHGLKGRGPNQYTGPRSAAKLKSTRIGYCGNFLNVIGMYFTYKQYEQELTKSPGPNLKRYLDNRYKREQISNAIGLFSIYGAAYGFGYNLGNTIEAIFGINIQYNPFTRDFTPIEKTLKSYDEMGVDIYK